MYTEVELPQKLRESIPAQHLDSLWVVSENNRPVARFSVYKNPELSYENHDTWCVGRYECIDNQLVAQYTLQQAVDYIRQKGGTYIIGPMNGSTWESYRFATTNDTTFFLEPLQRDWYATQWTNNGFAVLAGYESHIDEALLYDEPQLQYATEQLRSVNIELRSIDLAGFHSELKKMYALCSQVFQSNFLFTPTDLQAFSQKYLPIQPYLDADLFWLACDANQNIVGFLFAVPDHSDTVNRTAIVKTLCRLPGAAYKSVTPALCNQFMKTVRQKGYRRVIHAFMHKQNPSMNVSARFSGHSFKEYVLLGKPL
ncbi:MAG: hypothetical protein MUD08_16760 [Cytophagales bacterium]|nr:hypothetical protein [Cytophagales bacterium]